MIDFIKGQIAEVTPTYVVVEVNGIAYLLNISLNTFSKIREEKQCKLFAHLAFKNEASTPVGMVLYGFFDVVEREMFLHLLSVSGVGANTARLILSSMTPHEVQQAIVNGEVGLLKKVKGIGAKSAQRIIVDLKDKLTKKGLESDPLFALENNVKEEALAALVMLGFVKNSAEKAIDKVLKDKPDVQVEEVIKLSLQIL